MKMVITYKSGHKRVLNGCSFIEANTYDKPRGLYYEKPDKDGYKRCYDDVMTQNVSKVEIIMED